MSNRSRTAEISALELARALEAGEPVQVVDVRAPVRVASGRIEVVPEHRFHNVVGSRLLSLASLEGTGIDPELPVAVVCGKGMDSEKVARHLNGIGCRASSLQGGMAAWMKLVLARELEPPASLDRLTQFDRLGKGALGYLLASEGEAVIIDPPRDSTAYVRAAQKAGEVIVGVADTHIHADYISGAPQLARALGVPYFLHPADAVYPYDGTPGRVEFHPLESGQTITFGRCSLLARHTPGHTEGSSSYLVDDAVAFTGDFIFVDSVGRPDLAGKASEWTTQLWGSLQAVKREWSPDTMVYPGHYGSVVERRPNGSVGKRFGQLLEENEALRFSDSHAFARWASGQTASFPDAYRRIKAVNIELLTVDAREADELEFGRNECALGGR
jgi:glyoxylase-like metal-dependent hydrolase (beta-lactamase superfamily II)